MTRIIAKICIRRKCTSQTIHEFFVKPAKRAFSCTAKAVFVTRASDADRRSRRRGDAARRSLLPKRQRSVRGLLTRPSSNGVAALGPLRPLRGSRFALGQPDAFGAGECLKRLCRASDAPRFVVARQRKFLVVCQSKRNLERLNESLAGGCGLSFR